MQPSKHRRHQRLLPGIAFRVWSPTESMLETLAHVVDGSFQTAVSKSARCRLALLKLATELRALRAEHAHDIHHVWSALSASRAAQSLAVLHEQRSAESLAQNIAANSPLTQPMSCDEFSTFLTSHTSLAESDIRLVYEYMTCATTHTPSLLSILETLVSGVPTLDHQMQNRLQEIGPGMLHSAGAVESQTSDNESSNSAASDVLSDVARL